MCACFPFFIFFFLSSLSHSLSYYLYNSFFLIYSFSRPLFLSLLSLLLFFIHSSLSYFVTFSLSFLSLIPASLSCFLHFSLFLSLSRAHFLILLFQSNCLSVSLLTISISLSVAFFLFQSSKMNHLGLSLEGFTNIWQLALSGIWWGSRWCSSRGSRWALHKDSATVKLEFRATMVDQCQPHNQEAVGSILVATHAFWDFSPQD